MHLITGVLTKNNRSSTPVTQKEIWRGGSEMITASKSGRKIGSYYIWRLNGLFNKTLTACIISHSSLLKFIKILEVLFRVMPACTLLNPRTFLTLKVETMRIALLVAILNEAVVIQKFYSKLPLFMFLWQIVFFF